MFVVRTTLMGPMIAKILSEKTYEKDTREPWQTDHPLIRDNQNNVLTFVRNEGIRMEETT